MNVKRVSTNLGNGTNIEIFGYDIFSDYYKNCEPQTKRWMLRNLDRDNCFIDVGANIGILSRTALQIIDKGIVIAIEPTETFKILKKNLKNFDNVISIKKAVADFNGKITTSLEKVYRLEKETRDFEFYTLDSVVSDLNIEKVDLLKIDTDGWEVEVLKGAVGLITRDMPAIIVELNEGLLINQHNIQEVFELFVEYGYTNALICDGSNFIFTVDKDSNSKTNSSIEVKVDTETFPLDFDLGEEIFSLNFNFVSDLSTLNTIDRKLVSFKDNNPRWSYNCSLFMLDLIKSPLAIRIVGKVISGKLGILATSKDGSISLSREEIIEKVSRFEVLIYTDCWGGRLVFRNAGQGPIEVEIEALAFFNPRRLSN